MTTRRISFGSGTDAALATLAAGTPDATDDMLCTVYRRGASTYAASHHKGMSRSDWAMARVQAFTYLLTTGRPANTAYISDFDLLPSGHPCSTYKAVTASSSTDELSVTIPDVNTFDQPEAAVLALTEYMGMGYEVEPAIRASWMRAVHNGEDAYRRASLLASATYDSLDADLLPEPMEGDSR